MYFNDGSSTNAKAHIRHFNVRATIIRNNPTTFNQKPITRLVRIRDRVNEKVVEYLKRFMKQLQKEPARTELTLSDTFRLQFRIQENDNNTGWVERINNVGSDIVAMIRRDTLSDVWTTIRVVLGFNIMISYSDFSCRINCSIIGFISGMSVTMVSHSWAGRIL